MGSGRARRRFYERTNQQDYQALWRLAWPEVRRHEAIAHVGWGRGENSATPPRRRVHRGVHTPTQMPMNAG
ncbi:hypothetical protein FRAAL0021 [Frankia alni ACN14a]|uniref:Uncharacterized protein n=1 Tax=Frankia alni (strain DSM 45986 / CECT 9034 / ACN14a) TaxID=326424 RepID=Q0RUN5_FRAAA|nr:hypothetical protein FRAAL0021 [Frankia alni ACN14a]